MGDYKIDLVELPPGDSTFSSRQMEAGTGIKEAFWDDNLSIFCCIAMLLRRDLQEVRWNNPHILMYGKYLGGFLFEDFDKLPPLCILNVISVGIPYNSVYYCGMVYDPKIGTFTTEEYSRKFIKILGYIQIFIEAAYEQADWRPVIPAELETELDKDMQLKDFFLRLPSMQQSKVINYVHPFSKPSSLKERRLITQPLTPKQVDNTISHIRFMYQQQAGSRKNVWEELYDFETVEAVATLKKCGLNKGMTALDMGCGHAHYSIAASVAVGEDGKVIAVDHSKKILREAENRTREMKLSNITFLNADETGLKDYLNQIDFLILYDVLHGVEWRDNREEKLSILHSLLKEGGILSLALYNEIEHKPDPNAQPTPKGLIKTIRIPHEEAIKPYLELLQRCGFTLFNIVDNAGVHFDDFHSPYHWRKYGEVRVSKLERRNIYNFKRFKKGEDKYAASQSGS